MKAAFAKQWVETQKHFARKMQCSTYESIWESFFESMKTASVRGHKASATGNHVDLRINWNGRAKNIHIDSNRMSSPYAAQYILGKFVVDVVPAFKNAITDSMRNAKEWGLEEGVAIAELVFKEAEARGIPFCQQLVDCAGVLDQVSDAARRKHIMEASLREATPLIRKAISNGCDPQILIDLVNHCIVEDVLDN